VNDSQIFQKEVNFGAHGRDQSRPQRSSSEASFDVELSPSTGCAPVVFTRYATFQGMSLFLRVISGHLQLLEFIAPKIMRLLIVAGVIGLFAGTSSV